MANLIWLPEALDDIERMYDFLIEKNPAAARNAVLCIKAGPINCAIFLRSAAEWTKTPIGARSSRHLVLAHT